MKHKSYLGVNIHELEDIEIFFKDISINVYNLKIENNSINAMRVHVSNKMRRMLLHLDFMKIILCILKILT